MKKRIENRQKQLKLSKKGLCQKLGISEEKYDQALIKKEFTENDLKLLSKMLKVPVWYIQGPKYFIVSLGFLSWVVWLFIYLKERLILFATNTLESIVIRLKKHLPKAQIDKAIRSLAPKVLIDEKELERVKPYLDSLKDAINTEGINNIALAGNYGSGKSTVIKTFQHQNSAPEYNYLNISLASFTETDKSIEEVGKSIPWIENLPLSDDQKKQLNKLKEQDLEKKLEVSILQQMFYHVNPSKIPDSRFKRIISLSIWALILRAALLIIWLFCTILLFKFEKIDSLNPSSWNTNYNLDWIAVLSFLVFFSGIGWTASKMIQFISNSKITKLNFKGELELGADVDKSVFNKHLEEILYFFESTKFNVVVIEDIDRFENTNIFTKLREINTLINSSEQINRKVTFIYAVRDELFKDKSERVKFFEFIIPIIPFINPSNANDQLETLIEESGITDKELTPEFRSDIVTFIDDIDMRLLISIFNEFLIYKQSLKVQDFNKLFAIIVYKNLFPEDFGMLTKRQGNLFKFLNNHSSYVSRIQKKIDYEILKIEQDIVELDREYQTAVEELRAIYIFHLISKAHDFRYLYFDNVRIEPLMEAVTDYYFEKIKNSNIRNDQIQIFLHSSNRHVGYNFSTFQKEVSEVPYEKREFIIKKKVENKIEAFKINKEQLEKKKSEIERWDVAKVFQEVDIEEYLNQYEDFKDNKLIRSLFLNGYIDENYNDYISLFHEVTLAKEDFIFEQNVKISKPSQHDYSLQNADIIINRLPKKYFERKFIWNYKIVEALLTSNTEVTEKKNTFFTGLNSFGKKEFEFVNGFIEYTKEEKGLIIVKGLFIKELLIKSSNFWQFIHTQEAKSEKLKRELLLLIFNYAELQSICNQENLNSLINYLEELKDFTNLFSKLDNANTLQEFIVKHSIKVNQLDKTEQSPNELFEFLYHNNLYSINLHNISVLADYYKVEIKPNSHYSSLLESKMDSLLAYIENEIESYFNILLNLEDNTEENEDAIVRLVNSENIKSNLISDFTETQEIKILNLRRIEQKEIREILLTQNNVEPTWENIGFHFKKNAHELDEALIVYINNEHNLSSLVKKDFIDVEGNAEENYKSFSNILLHNDGITDEIFSSLLDSIPNPISKIDLSHSTITVSKIEIIISKDLINLTIEDFEELKRFGNLLHIRLIEHHQEEFVEIFNNFSLEIEDWKSFFSSPEIEASSKIAIIKDHNFDDTIIIENTVVARQLAKVLPIKERIELLFEVFSAIFSLISSKERQVTTLNIYLDQLNDEQIKSLMVSMGGEYLKTFKSKKQPEFPKNDQHEKLFQKLYKRQLVGKSKKNFFGDDTIKFYTKKWEE